MRPKSEMLEELSTMLRDVLRAREQGGSYPRIARDQGYVDGYMKALLECGVVDQRQLLRLVARQRETVFGPATARFATRETVAA